MSKRYIFLAIIPFLCCFLNAQHPDGIFRVVIDAGHGGKDPGCIGRNKIKEKDVNLAISLRLGQLIEKNHKDVKVIYTRKTDIFVPLIQRTEIANRHKADLFVSIHADAVAQKNAASAYGAGTFTLGTAKTQENLEVAKRENAVILLEEDYQTSYQGFDPNSAESYIMFETLQGTHQTQSIQLASLIQQEFRTRAKRHDRQVRQAPYLVLKTAGMPAVLVESGFLSNTNEAKFLATTNGRHRIAESIYHGFKNYKDAFDRHNSATLNPIKGNKEGTATQTSVSRYTTNKNQNIEAKQNNLSNRIVYKVQILSHQKKLSKGASELKGVWPVDSYKQNGMYRYTYGSETNFAEITRLQKKMRSKFKDAFIVRFQNGQRIK